MRRLLDYRLGWLHSGGHVRIGLTIRLVVSAGLHVEAAAGNLAGIDTALVAGRGSLDMSGVDSGSGWQEIDDSRVDDWTDDEVSW